LPLLLPDVAAGRLVTPFPAIMVQRMGYVALIPFDANKTSALTNFIDCLVTEARDDAASLASICLFDER
jgi:LysR family transcriptional regulator, glycine cleavage system transcriptional activator